MPIEVFQIPAMGDAEAAAELNRFLAGRKILSVERRLVDSVASPYWTFCVEYLDATPATTLKNARMGKKVDYREVLDEAAFRRFAAMRQKRKELAEANKLPAFAIFTNEELAGIARLDGFSMQALHGIEGISEEKARKWGLLLKEAWEGDSGNSESKEIASE